MEGREEELYRKEKKTGNNGPARISSAFLPKYMHIAMQISTHTQEKTKTAAYRLLKAAAPRALNPSLASARISKSRQQLLVGRVKGAPVSEGNISCLKGDEFPL